MRIAVLTNTTSQSTGTGRIASIYNELLVARGHEVRVFGPALWFEKMNTTSPVARLFRHLSDLRPNPSTVSEILEWKPDALLTHNLTGCGFGTPRMIREAGIRWVHVLHDVQLFEPSGRVMFGESRTGFLRFWRKLWAALRVSALGSPDMVVSPTAWLLNIHHQYGFFSSTQEKVIPNPLRVEVVDPFSIERDPHRLVFVGRLDEDKGVDLLYDAWSKLRDVVSEIVVIGDGSWRSKFEALRSPSVVVRGILPNADVFRALVSAGIFVAPSRVAENQPTVVLEALAAGCRVIAADVGGVGETLGNAGWLMQPGSIDALVNTVHTAVSTQDDKQRSTEREQILRTHDPDSAVEALLGVLTSNA